MITLGNLTHILMRGYYDAKAVGANSCGLETLQIIKLISGPMEITDYTEMNLKRYPNTVDFDSVYCMQFIWGK